MHPSRMKTKSISRGSLRGIAVQLSLNLKPEWVARVDEARGTQSRSGFVAQCIYEHFSGGNADKTHLNEQLMTYKNEVEYLRQEYSKINDALAQRLLTEATPPAPSEPKRHWWQRKKKDEPI
jgi:hypothetical protein